jgi:homoserine dehydrogenase
VAQLLTEHADDLAARVGRPLELVGIGVRRAGRARSVPASTRRCSPPTRPSWSPAPTSSSRSIGGIEPARSLILRAMEHGASVVTANKALLAEDGPTLYAAAARHGVDLYYEAAVAGGIPLLRPLREILAGDSVRKVIGIVNGTTNYVLDKMDTTGPGSPTR